MRPVKGNYYYYICEDGPFLAKGVIKVNDLMLNGQFCFAERVNVQGDEKYIKHFSCPETNLLIVGNDELLRNLGNNKKIIETLYGEDSGV